MPATLSPARRSELRAEAHKLAPVVLIGDKGLTDDVIAEIDRSLKAHELIKVRATGADRDVRGTWLDTICTRLAAHPVQLIGKVFVIYRENPEEESAPSAAPRKGAGGDVRKAQVLTEQGKLRQRARDAEKRKQRDVEDMVRRGKIPVGARLGPKSGPRAKPAPGPKSGARLRGDGGSGDAAATRTSRPRPRTPSPLPESAPRRRRPRTSR
jgi:putative YhbY family RNA-binding protein